jgi:hypothetical protein
VAERRRYTKRQKAVAVTAAIASSTMAASEQTGIPRKTIAYWMDAPEFAALRQKTRDDLARGFELLAHRSQEVLMSKVADMEPRDLTVLLGVATDKSQLLAGHATERVESKDITDVFDDHEKRAIVAGAVRYLEGAGSTEGPGVAQETAVEDAGA